MLLPLALLTLNAAPLRVSMFPGSQRVIDAPSVTRLGLSDEKVAEVQTLGSDRILITGDELGTTRLVYFDGRGLSHEVLIHVYRKDDTVYLFMPFFRGIGEFGLGAELHGEQSFMTGTLRTEDGLRKAAALHRDLKTVSLLKLKVDPKLLVAKLEETRGALASAGYGNLHLEVAGGAVMLEGTVEDASDARKVAALVAPLQQMLQDMQALRDVVPQQP